jgi:hypothetical protein
MPTCESCGLHQFDTSIPMCESCLNLVGCIPHGLHQLDASIHLYMNLVGCASCGLHQLDASMHLSVNLVSILLGVRLVACIDWMLLYTHV